MSTEREYDLDEIIAEVKLSDEKASPTGDAAPAMPAEASSAPETAPAAPEEAVSAIPAEPEESREPKVTPSVEKAISELFADDRPERKKPPKAPKKKPEAEKKPKKQPSLPAGKPEKRPPEPPKEKKVPPPKPVKEKAAPPPKPVRKKVPSPAGTGKTRPIVKEHKALPYDFINRTYRDSEEAVRILTRQLVSAGIRLLILVPLALAALYMTLTFSLPLPMPFGFTYFSKPYLYLLVYLLLDAAALLLAADVTVAGAVRLFKLRPTLDSLVFFSSVCSIAYTLGTIIRPERGAYLPFTAITVCVCFISLAAKRRRYSSLKCIYKVLQLDSMPSAVKTFGRKKSRASYKTSRGVFPDMHALSVPDKTERLSLYYAPIALVVCIALAFASSVGKADAAPFLWCLSALSVVVASPALIISSAMPQGVLSRKLYTSGSAIVNTKTASELNKSRFAVVTDDDVFPVGSVSIISLKAADQYSLEYVYSVMASALEAVGGGIHFAFDNGARQLYASHLSVSDVRFFESGGMSANVEGSEVLIGTAAFLDRMGVRNIAEVKLQNCLFLSVNARFAGVFALKYTPQPPVWSAFRFMKHAKAKPVLAVRDCNLTQAFVESKFKLHAEVTDFPPMEERVKLSNDEPSPAPPAAIMTRTNMFSFAEILLACRRLCRSVRFNIILSLFSSVAGTAIMYFLTSNAEYSAASPLNLLIYSACCFLPVWLSSLILTSL